MSSKAKQKHLYQIIFGGCFVVIIVVLSLSIFKSVKEEQLKYYDGIMTSEVTRGVSVTHSKLVFRMRTNDDKSHRFVIKKAAFFALDTPIELKDSKVRDCNVKVGVLKDAKHPEGSICYLKICDKEWVTLDSYNSAHMDVTTLSIMAIWAAFALYLLISGILKYKNASEIEAE